MITGDIARKATVDGEVEKELVQLAPQYSGRGDTGVGSISKAHAPARSPWFSGLIFAALLVVMCSWILSLPLFPSQDGPMHRYYVHALDSMLRHNGSHGDYQIRRPIPPYVTHYAALLLLSRMFSYDVAEKILVCLIVLCLGYGLRFSGRQIGPAGEWATVLCTPVLLAWPLMAGMFNFVLGIGLALFATGFWQRIPKYGLRSLAAFTAVLLVLTYTHPVPLLLLIAVCGLNLLLSLLLNPHARSSPISWLREHRWQCAGFLSTLAAAAIPLSDMDRSQTHSTLSEFGLHLRVLAGHILLYGFSPYNSRSHSLWINAYRLCIYAVFAGCVWVGARSTIRIFRQKKVNFGATCFLAMLLLAVAVPFLPNDVNGSAHFADRFLIVLWSVAILAASAAPLPSFRQRVMIGYAGLGCCACTLMAAQTYIRPAAHQLQMMEFEPLPVGTYGTILQGYLQGQYVRYNDQLVFNPFKWAPALAFVHQNDIVLNSPFISQKIAPLEAKPQSPLLNTEKDTIESSNIDLSVVPGPALPRWQEDQVVRNSSFIVYVATPQELTRELSERLVPEDAARYECGPSHSWYIVCVELKQRAATQ